MRVLLDTHVLIWAVIDPDRLSVASRKEIAHSDNEVLFSASSIWEIGIKHALGRADFRLPPEAVLAAAVETGFRELPITADVALTVKSLPHHHRDPFDRLLVAQALAEPAILLTADRQLLAYSELVRLA